MSLELLTEYIEKADEMFEDELPLQDIALEIERDLLPDHVAILLEAFPLEQRLNLWKLFSSDSQQLIFLEMKNESRQMILNVLHAFLYLIV
jgi:magnesium transporter